MADKSADQILSAALAAVNGAKSVHLKASGNSGGQPISFDLKLVAGSGGSGSITANGLSFEIVRIGDRAYFKAGLDFWTQFTSAAASQRLAEKWISSSATTGRLATFSSLTDLGGFVTTALENHGSLEKGSESTLDGQPVIAITDTTQGGTLYVATTGKPYPIKIVDTSSDGGTFALEEWDAPVVLTAPADSIDLDSFGGG